MPGNTLEPYYDVIFEYHGKDLSIAVESVDIFNSLEAVYQTVVIKFYLDENQISREELFGHGECKLSITQTTESSTQTAPVEFDLYVVDTKYPMVSKPPNPDGSNDHPMNTMVTLITVPSVPLKAMSQPVNLIIPEDKVKPPIDILKDLTNKFIPYVNIDIKENGKNQEPVRQCLIPPLPFSAALDSLDREFGIFNGPLFYQCRHEDNTLSVWDLSQQLNEKLVYKVYSLSDSKKDEEIYKKSGTGDEFYTYSPIQFKSESQQKMLKEGYKHVFISKPSDKLFHRIDKDFSQVFKDSTFNSGGELHVNDVIKDRTKIYNQFFTGMETNESFVNSYLGKKLMDSASIKFSMSRNLQINNLCRVGVPIEMIFESMSYTNHSGVYLTRSSRFKLTKQNNMHFMANCDLSVFRANILT